MVRRSTGMVAAAWGSGLLSSRDLATKRSHIDDELEENSNALNGGEKLAG
jgi:hypothetical protein